MPEDEFVSKWRFPISPCPFCGGEESEEHVALAEIDEQCGLLNGYAVECTCFARGPVSVSGGTAILLWNLAPRN